MIMLNNRPIIVNNRPLIIGASSEPEPPTPTYPIYQGWAFKAAKTASPFGRVDLAPGTSKRVSNPPTSYSHDVTDDTTAKLNKTMDWIDFDIVEGHIYEAVWGLSDLQATFGSSSTKALPVSEWGTNYNSSPVFYELYAMDFCTLATISGSMSWVTVIPQIADNIHNGNRLISCSYLFQYAPITNSLEKFILAMQTACPNLTTTIGCFSGCTTAPDYNYCRTTYPNWF